MDLLYTRNYTKCTPNFLVFNFFYQRFFVFPSNFRPTNFRPTNFRSSVIFCRFYVKTISHSNNDTILLYNMNYTTNNTKRGQFSKFFSKKRFFYKIKTLRTSSACKISIKLFIFIGNLHSPSSR